MNPFSNGAEFQSWSAQQCDRCFHMPPNPGDGGCAIVAAMMSIEGEGADDVIECIIPTDPETGQAGKCSLFLERALAKAGDFFDKPTVTLPAADLRAFCKEAVVVANEGFGWQPGEHIKAWALALGIDLDEEGKP